MISLMCVLLLLIATLKLWPVQESSKKDSVIFRDDDEIFIEQPIITIQNRAPASPPRPQVPVPVPTDEVIEEEIEFPEFGDIVNLDPIKNEDGSGQQGTGGEIVNNPERPPGLIKITEPTIPEAAKQAGIKAEVMVTFLVDTNGRVEEAFISGITLYEGDTSKEVDEIGFGVMEAVLNAAVRWRFRPAKENGKAVKTYVQNSFNIGF